MSKKMWAKIFKSKTPKNSKIKNGNGSGNENSKSLNRCSIYEEFQQLNGLSDFETTSTTKSLKNNKPTEHQQKQEKLKHQNKENEKFENLSIYDFEFDFNKNVAQNQNQSENEFDLKINSIPKIFNFDEQPLPALVNQQQQQSTFSKVVNTFTLNKRPNNNNNNNKKNDRENENHEKLQTKKETKILTKSKNRFSNSTTTTTTTPTTLSAKTKIVKTKSESCFEIQQKQKRVGLPTNNQLKSISIVLNRIEFIANDENDDNDENFGRNAVSVDCIFSASSSTSATIATTTHTNNANKVPNGTIEVLKCAQSSVIASSENVNYTNNNNNNNTNNNYNNNNSNNKNLHDIKKYDCDTSEKNKIAANDTDDKGAPKNLAPCPNCGRTFNAASLSKHVNICQKMTTKKRKPFDSSRQRREGTELASYLPKNFGLPASKQIAENTLTEEKLVRNTARASMRKQSTASTGNGGNGNGSGNARSTTPTTPASPKPRPRTERHHSVERPKRGQPTPPSSDQCPHCDRFFGIKAYDRHVEWCKEKALQTAVKNSNSSEKEKAKERLAARTKYRAPIKTKRSLNREKYAGMTGDENDADDCSKIMDSEALMTASVTSDSIEIDNLSMRSIELASISESLFDEMGNQRLSSSNTPKNPRSAYEFKNIEEMRYEVDRKQRVPTPRPHSRQTQRMRSCKTTPSFENVEENENSAEEDCAFAYQQSSRRSSFQMQRQLTDPNLCMNMMCGMPTTMMYSPMQQPTYQDLQMPMQLQMQAPMTMPLSLPTYNVYNSAPVMNLELTSLQMNRRLQKMQRKYNSSGAFANGVHEDNDATFTHNPSTPMKAFSMPLQSLDGLDMPQMYNCAVPNFSNDCRANEIDHTETNFLTPNQTDSSESVGTAKCFEYDFAEGKNLSATGVIEKPSEESINFDSDLESALINNAYDPFLTAKRQLEELCAPGSPPDNNNSTRYNTKTISTPTTPSPSLPTKMTTSLTLSVSIPTTSSTTNKAITSPLTPTTIMAASVNYNTPQQQRKQSLTTITPSTSFRRTSSLRGPRRSPLLPTRPLFAQKPSTIQRGLSDEGPISSNFLKSEEYDEIPVRSVCVNDFAITNSPRVVRRDTSLSNRKNSLKLNLEQSPLSPSLLSTSTTTTGNASNNNTTQQEQEQRQHRNPHQSSNIEKPIRDLLKTDSLAAFLKFERDLEKLNNDMGSDKHLPWQDNETTPIQSNTTTHALAFTKELKDKSNTLSKRNSAKNLRIETTDAATAINAETQQQQQPKQQTSPLTVTTQNTTDNGAGNLKNGKLLENTKQIRLEPIERVSQIPQLNNNNTNSINSSTNSFTTTKRNYQNGGQLPPLSQQSQQQQQQQQQQNVNLNTLLGNTKSQQPQQQSYQPKQKQTSTNNATTSCAMYDKENKVTTSTEYIDPKLINKCDNLPVKLADLKFIDSDSSSDQQSQYTHSHVPNHHQQQQQPQPQQRCDRGTDPYEQFSTPISQLSKLMPLKTATTRNAQTQSTPKHTSALPTTPTPNDLINNNNNNNHNHSHNSQHQQRNSNLLKRKIRPGRNQFLYDASPEAIDIDSACSADDEANPRSSAEFDSLQLESTFERMFQKQTPQYHLRNQQTTATATSSLPATTMTPPFFDDFDFEDFLSSFENDEEQFPLFRDCREFIKNRTQQRQTATKKTTTTTPTTTTPKQFFNPNNGVNMPNYFQFPNLNSTPIFDSNINNNKINVNNINNINNNNNNKNNVAHLINSTNSTRRSNSKLSMLQNVNDGLGDYKETLNETVKSDDYYSARSGDSISNSFPQRSMNHQQEQQITNCDDDAQKREIFISIETDEHSDESLGTHHMENISAESLRNMVGNSQAIVEVEVVANDNKFRKITDDDDDDVVNVHLNNVNGDEYNNNSNNQQRILPNVQLNNAKNLLQKMQEKEAEMNNDCNVKEKSANCNIDSDEMSSLDGYPVASTSSSRRSAGVSSKTSADSAYGSLSRQRSNEAMGIGMSARSASRNRPATTVPGVPGAAAAVTSITTNNNAAAQIQHKQFLLQQQYQHQQQQQLMLQQQQQQIKYAQSMMKGARTRQLSASSSSSSSDNSLPPLLLTNASHFQQQQQQQQQQQLLMQHQQQQQLQQQQQQQIAQLYQHTKARSRGSPIQMNVNATATNYSLDMLNANHPALLLSNSMQISTTSSGSVGNKPMSRFCHECGSQFLVEHAKFCMDCGVKRLMI